MNQNFNHNKMNEIQSYFSRVATILESIDLEKINVIINLINSYRLREKKIFIIGNGGSASTAEHMSTDLMFNTKELIPRLKVISLTSNSAKITATGNDIGFNEVFSRQLEILATQEDLLIHISASGNSKNLLAASKVAKSKKMLQVAFLGFDGGKLKNEVDDYLLVTSKIGEYGPVEDVHLMLNHIIVEKLKSLA